MIDVGLLIGGRDVFAPRRSEVRDPGRLSEVVGSVAAGTAEHVDAAVRAAHAAGPGWRALEVPARVAQVVAAADALEALTDTLAALLVREQGMLLRDTRRDMANGVRSLREMAAVAEDALRPERFEDDEALVLVEKAARGVVAAIVPWNAPMGLTMAKVAPALLAGNTIVVKPSEHAPLAVSQALACVAGHFPAGAINVVHGAAEVGQALARHPLVRKVSFTGGVRTGKAVMAAAADTVKNIGLELGGNDPAIVLDDADPAAVVPDLIRGIFPRSGQVCYAVKRVYVPHAMLPAFADALCAAVDTFRIGHGLDPRATFAPVNNRHQFEFVRGLVARSRAAGAQVRELGSALAPGDWDNGYYLRPAVVTGLDPQAELVVCEQFGPVIPIVGYGSEEEALRMANDTEFGLASSVWTADPERGLRLARRLEAGVSFVNSHRRTPLGDRHMPFGGVKQSGIGRVRTPIGLAEYVEHHAISVRKLDLRRTGRPDA